MQGCCRRSDSCSAKSRNRYTTANSLWQQRGRYEAGRPLWLDGMVCSAWSRSLCIWRARVAVAPAAFDGDPRGFSIPPVCIGSTGTLCVPGVSPAQILSFGFGSSMRRVGFFISAISALIDKGLVSPGTERQRRLNRHKRTSRQRRPE
jgi:hypothetical protein